ncbi:MAG: hypothetical protein EA394_09875 [Bacteroidia bacterium]|nr:MAG: hypothetical protein EA394_09875 [Bacteroidia bacterium]
MKVPDNGNRLSDQISEFRNIKQAFTNQGAQTRAIFIFAVQMYNKFLLHINHLNSMQQLLFNAENPGSCL